MKKVYQNPIVNVLSVDAEDVITTSVLDNTQTSGSGMVQSINEIMGL